MYKWNVSYLTKLSQETKLQAYEKEHADLKFMFDSEFNTTIAWHRNINNKLRKPTKWSTALAAIIMHNHHPYLVPFLKKFQYFCAKLFPCRSSEIFSAGSTTYMQGFNNVSA